MKPVLSIRGVSKRFVMHQQGGAVLPVLDGVDLDVFPGECVVLDGPSGMGKSTLLKLVYANYLATSGQIGVRDAEDEVLEVTQANARDLLRMRRDVVGYVSQFLRAIPRVSALDIVAAHCAEGTALSLEQAREQARGLLARLRIGDALMDLPPATFSGGEQQRVNIAANLIKPKQLVLLDEPTASLDAANAQTVMAMVREALARGAAVVGIFHDADVAQALATRRVDVAAWRTQA